MTYRGDQFAQLASDCGQDERGNPVDTFRERLATDVFNATWLTAKALCQPMNGGRVPNIVEINPRTVTVVVEHLGKRFLVTVQEGAKP